MGSTTVLSLPRRKTQNSSVTQRILKLQRCQRQLDRRDKCRRYVRAYGDRSEDGTTFAAEEVVTGASQTTIGTVKSVDAAKNEVVITDNHTKKDITVAVGAFTIIEKIPGRNGPEIGGMQMGGGAGGRPRTAARGLPGTTPPAGGQRTAPRRRAAPANGRARTGTRYGGGGRGGIDEMLERFDNITLADLKAGDMIAVVSARNPRMPTVLTLSSLFPVLSPF